MSDPFPAHPGKPPVQAHCPPPPPPLEGRPHRRPGPAVPLHVGVRVPGSLGQGSGPVQGGGSGGRRSRCSMWWWTGRSGSISTSLSTSRWGRGRSGRCSIRLRRRSPRLSAGPGSGRPPTLCGSSRAAGFPSPASTRWSSIRRRSSRRGRSSPGIRSSRSGRTSSWSRRSRSQEEPALEGKAKVVYRGEIRFNYPVKPETLAPLVKLVDPGGAQAASRSSSRRTTRTRSSATARSPSRRSGTSGRSGSPSPARSPPPSGNAPLGEEYVKEIEVGSSTKLSVRNVEAQPGPRESTIKVTFSSPISAAVAEKYVKIDPAVRRCGSRRTATSCRSPARWSRARPTPSRSARGCPPPTRPCSRRTSSRTSSCPTSIPRSASRARGCSSGTRASTRSPWRRSTCPRCG